MGRTPKQGQKPCKILAEKREGKYFTLQNKVEQREAGR